MAQDRADSVALRLPGECNPNKLQNLRPGQGAVGRKNQCRSIANKLRRYLESSKGVDEQGHNRRDQIFATMVEIATDKGHPHAVAAAQLLLDRAYGKVMPSEELESVGKGNVQFIIVNRPAPGEVQPMEVRPPLPAQPIFDDEWQSRPNEALALR